MKCFSRSDGTRTKPRAHRRKRPVRWTTHALLDKFCSMRETLTARERPAPFGELLRNWRQTRGLSQLALATDLAISSRHLSFIETGRAKPSRDMVLLLSEGLNVPLRDRNDLLLAAGFAPAFQELPLGSSELKVVQMAITAMLEKQEPYPAVVLNRRWDVLASNRAAKRFFRFITDRAPAGTPNILVSMFDPNLARRYVEDWEQVATALIRRVHREVPGGVPDKDLIERLMAYPGVADAWRLSTVDRSDLPVIPIAVRRNGIRLAYFSTVTTIGTPQDVTSQEVRIESFFPLDVATAERARDMATQDLPGESAMESTQGDAL